MTIPQLSAITTPIYWFPKTQGLKVDDTLDGESARRNVIEGIVDFKKYSHFGNTDTLECNIRYLRKEFSLHTYATLVYE
jgi:hypothetical protein